MNAIELKKISLCEMQSLKNVLLTVNEKYSLLNRDNLRHPIQMQLTQKNKTFSQFDAPFLKCRLNIEYFPKKDAPRS